MLGKVSYCAVVSSFMVMQIGLIPTVLANEKNLENKAQTCSQLSDNKARLTCFDALTVKNTTTTGSVNDKSVVTPVGDSKRSAQYVDNFAKEQVKNTSDEQAEEIQTITLTISKLSKNLYGKWKITFQNGQKWQQKDSEILSLKEGQRVVLTKGALSAIYLQKENTNKRIKVKRVK